jgi:hypothetical protein
MTSLYASEIGTQFSEPILDVKAFLFVQTNREVARCASETRAVTLSTKIRIKRNFLVQSIIYGFYPLSFAKRNCNHRARR